MTEQFDSSLFGSAEEAQEAQSLFDAGKTLADKGNPVGVFQVEIEDATLGAAQSSGNLQITYKLTVLVGALKDTVLMKYSGLKKDTQVKMALDELKRLGVDTAKLTFDKLPATLLSLKGSKAVVKAQQNNEFYNIYFQKAIKTVTPGTTTPTGTGKGKF